MNMNYILKNIYFLQLCQCALGSLPAPVNVTVESLNFEHKLRWDPGPGSPPDTTYIVQYSPCHNTKLPLHVPNYMVAVVKQTLQQCTRDPFLTYTIKVRASHHGKKSPWREKQFSPSLDTALDPPVLTVSGCGDCLTLSITFPEFIQQVYVDIHYNISWKRAGQSEVRTLFMKSSRVKLQYLERGMEYCVQVHAQVNSNSNIPPSELVCAFTSPVAWNPVPAVLSSVAVLLLLGGLALLGLIYAGVLCKIKTHLPHILTSLVGPYSYYCHAPEETAPDRVNIITEGVGASRGGGGWETSQRKKRKRRRKGAAVGYSGSAGLWSGMAEQVEPLWRVGAKVDVVKNMGGEEDGGTELGKDVNLLSVRLETTEEDQEEQAGQLQLLLSTGSGEGPLGTGSED
ncbi:hypothetical protein AGOR_G00220490 [Albula goreensis]|uniref:Fibronectin type-III domain-containing protein n=1 Tax=Albula goreensis TaxID=1534307 RepID=A0A8T3CM16_9TELE|nr:hypothetical protein AGOR_G00220490 [Albula goreensis]